MARLHAAKCPTCGANIRVDPGASSAVCRYCQNVITIEKRAPPPMQVPFGMPGGIPSRTLYIDPKQVARAGKGLAAVIVLSAVLPVLIPLGIFVGGPLLRTVKGSVRPFPATCGLNEELSLTGDFDGPGPAITSVGINCKIKISKSNIKAASLVEAAGPNFELTITDSTVETTGAAVKGGVNTKIRVKGGSIKSGGPVFDAKSNLEIALDGTTIESTAGTAILGSSLHLEAKNAIVRGKKSAIEIENGAEVKAEATTFESEDSTFVFESNPKINLTGGAVISKKERAIDGESNMELTVAGTKVQGVTGAVVASNANLKVKASDKASFLATDGHAFDLGSNGKLTFADVTVEAARSAIKAKSNLVVTLKSGTRLSGKRGGISADVNFEIDANGAVIDGGAGAGLEAKNWAKVTMRGGSVKGNPAMNFERKPSPYELEGTKIIGGAKLVR